MNFKNFFLLREREYFNKLIEWSSDTINKLENKLKTMHSIHSHTRVEINGIKFAFYKGKGHLEYATYFNGVVKIYVHSLYGDVKNFNFFKLGLPDRLKAMIFHELSHAHEDSKNNLEHNKKSTYYDLEDGKSQDDAGYFNSTTEVNARISEKLYLLLTPYILKLAKDGKSRDAFRVLMHRVKKEWDIKLLNDENGKRYIKNLYTTFINLIDKQNKNNPVQ